MAKFKLIPAIDIIDGKCVRLTKGDYSTSKIYKEDPVEAAKWFEGAGLQHLHVVDLDGAKAGKIINHKTLERIASATNMTVDFGGGIKTDDDIALAFSSGAQKITAGSIAVKNAKQVISWISKYGADKIILGADVNKHLIAINGWQENSSLNIFDFVTDYIEKGISQIICTDISKDGALAGPAFELYADLQNRFPSLQIIASGGVSCLDDVRKLDAQGVAGVIVGKAFYEGKIDINEVAEEYGKH